MRIVLIGRTGQVARALFPELNARGQVTVLGRADLDLADPDAAAAFVLRLRPEIVINAAAYTAVDRAESERDLAFAVNAETPGRLAAAAADLGALFVHYSTDYVFDGEKAEPYFETDAPHPISVYGESKRAGEDRVLEAGGRHLIFRTSWVHGPGGQHFAAKILSRARTDSELRVVSDQMGAPTSASLIARVTAAALAAPDLPSGLYHLTAAGATSWHGYALHVLEKAREAGVPLRAEQVIAVGSDAFPAAARRPHNSRLSTAKLRSALGLTLPHWTEDCAPTLAALFREVRS